jgi:hypothetical protein
MSLCHREVNKYSGRALTTLLTPGFRKKIGHKIRLIALADSMSVLDATKPLPRIQPRGAGSHPDEGQFPHLRPALGRTPTNHALAAVSKPLQPDNARQTVIQPSSPPNLKFTMKLKLPNIIDGMSTAGPHDTVEQLALWAWPWHQAEPPEGDIIAPTR